MSLCINFLRSCDFAILARLNWFLSQVVVVINFDSLLDMYVSYETRATLHVWLTQSPSSSSPPQWNERGTIAGDPDGIGHACLVVNVTWLKQSLYIYIIKAAATTLKLGVDAVVLLLAAVEAFVACKYRRCDAFHVNDVNFLKSKVLWSTCLLICV